MQLIFLGPPGAGKGTQARKLARQWQVPHISTGDILREAIAKETTLGLDARTYVESGELVPDKLVMSLMRERFGQPDMTKGWVLDGFPRTVTQAQALDELLSLLRLPYPKVIYFEVMDGLLIDRLLARGRQDDTVATIRRRLEVYKAETAPLIDYYERRLCLTTVNGSRSIDEVAGALSHLGEKETGEVRFIKDEAELDELMTQAPLLVVDCTATWCGPCKLVAPLMDQLAEEYGDRIQVFKLDLDSHKSVAKRFGVKGIPAVMFFKEGVRVETLVGVKPYEVFSSKVAQLL